MSEPAPHDPGTDPAGAGCPARLAELGRHAAPRQHSTVRLRRDPGAPADAVVYLNRGDLPSYGSEREHLQATLTGVEWIVRVRPRRGAFELTFSDELVARWAERLARGETPALRADGSMSGRRLAVQFLDVNLTKGLHLGHLRNASLGEATASMLEAAGARVTRRAWHTDMGRSSFEALAGVMARNPDLTPPEIKPDHFVGSCYVDYVDAVRGRGGDSARSPIDRELEQFGDLAEDLMQRWLAGDDAVRDPWLQVRDWVVEGQRATLERIGVRIDEALYQSDCLADLDRLIAAGLDRRLLDRRDSGEIVYRGDGVDDECITLVREDGFPTEYARMIAMIWRDQPIADRYDAAVSVAGAEWQPVGDPFRELLTNLGPCPLYDKVDLTYHGMCTVEGAKMKSHSKDAVLIDDLLDELAADPRLREGAARCGPSGSADALAGIVARLYLLARNPRAPVDFSWGDLVSEERNPGWLVCRVFSRTHGAEGGTAGVRSAATDAGRRLMVAQAHEYPSRLRVSIETRDPRPLSSHLIRICETYESMPPSAELTGMTRTLVNRHLRALGLLADRN